jgi:hypothetical protein
MNRLRQGNTARISFFSFQDIITSVTGILILVTLMLSFSMQTTESTEAQPESRLRAERERLREIEQQNQTLQQWRIEASTLPDASQLQTQLAALRRETEQLDAQRKQSETTLQSLRERAAKSPNITELRAEIKNLDARIQDLQSKIAHERTNQNVLYIVPDADAQRAKKKPAIFVVSGNELRAQRLDGSEMRSYPIAFRESLAPALRHFKPEQDFIVFYFRPSGAKWFDAFRDTARAAGFEVGYDALEEDKEIIFNAP